MLDLILVVGWEDLGKACLVTHGKGSEVFHLWIWWSCRFDFMECCARTRLEEKVRVQACSAGVPQGCGCSEAWQDRSARLLVNSTSSNIYQIMKV